ncbi:hypothetical protein RHGRI_009805 [Rhododendron griersonianum]|uniref:DEK-C domain-containing protein n=1 Tax=Rhododendron griersonianum TaxID=479676 RepID=A0AAV6KGV4_9ERIC|nr:hypothetical protein RHGRI_009805 [Rhododendron griersonianum]
MTTGTVRRKLEEDFEIDLSEKKAFIREQVDVYLQNHLKTFKADDDEGEGSEAEAATGVKSGEEEEEEEEEEEGEEEDVETSNGKGVVERG